MVDEFTFMIILGVIFLFLVLLLFIIKEQNEIKEDLEMLIIEGRVR